MKTLVSALFIILVGLSLINTQTLTVNATKAPVNSLTPFQYQYYANGTLTNFDIQNVQSQGDFFISMVANNNIYYNNFSFYDSPSAGYQLTNNDFHMLSVNTSYVNSSTTITASQYFITQKMTVFLIYFIFNEANYLYVFVYNVGVNNLLQKQLYTNMTYFKTNKIIKFTNSNDIFLELRTTNSFIILDVSSSNYIISKAFESKKSVDLSINSFEVLDPQLINNVFYVIFSEWNRNTNYYNSSVYAFSTNSGSSIQIASYYFTTFISSLTIVNNLLFAYSPFDNIAHVVDLGTHQQKYKIDNLIADNFSFIRAFDANSFILGDYHEALYYCYVQQQGNSYYMKSNNTDFILNTNTYLIPQYFNEQPRNDEFTLALVGDYNYLLIGYTYTNYGTRTGFGIVYHSMNNPPKLFLAPIITISSGATTSTVSITNSSLFSMIVLSLIVLGFLIAVFIFASKGKRGKAESNWNYNAGNHNPFYQNSLPNKKVCNSCGVKVSVSDLFCQNCGDRIQ